MPSKSVRRKPKSKTLPPVPSSIDVHCDDITGPETLKVLKKALALRCGISSIRVRPKTGLETAPITLAEAMGLRDLIRSSRNRKGLDVTFQQVCYPENEKAFEVMREAFGYSFRQLCLANILPLPWRNRMIDCLFGSISRSKIQSFQLYDVYMEQTDLLKMESWIAAKKGSIQEIVLTGFFWISPSFVACLSELSGDQLPRICVGSLSYFENLPDLEHLEDLEVFGGPFDDIPRFVRLKRLTHSAQLTESAVVAEWLCGDNCQVETLHLARPQTTASILLLSQILRRNKTIKSIRLTAGHLDWQTLPILLDSLLSHDDLEEVILDGFFPSKIDSTNNINAVKSAVHTGRLNHVLLYFMDSHQATEISFQSALCRFVRYVTFNCPLLGVWPIMIGRVSSGSVIRTISQIEPQNVVFLSTMDLEEPPGLSVNALYHLVSAIVGAQNFGDTFASKRRKRCKRRTNR